MKPTKIHPDTIIQPNRVTMMRYAVKPLEENLFTLVMESFQAELYEGKIMDRNLWGEPVINLNLQEIAPKQKPADAFKALKEVKRREFGYTYISQKNGQEIEVDGVLFPTILKSGNYVQVKINTDALPFLLWLGESGGQKTFFNKTTAMSLSGGHSKRLYKMLCSWKKAGGWRVKIDDFKESLGVKHSLGNLKKKVLEPAKEEMFNNQKSDIWFEYSTETSEELRQEGGKGRKPHDQLVFKIHVRYQSKNEKFKNLDFGGEKGKSLGYIYGFLQTCLGQTNPNVHEIYTEIENFELLEIQKLNKDMNRLLDKFDKEKDKALIFNSFMKPLREIHPLIISFKKNYNQASWKGIEKAKAEFEMSEKKRKKEK